MNLRLAKILTNLSVLATLVMMLGVSQPNPVNAAVLSPNQNQFAPVSQPAAPSAIPGALGIPPMTGKPSVDGICSVDEYAGALVETFTDGNGQQATVYIAHDGFFLYVCMQAQPGTFPERFGSLYLDPQGDGSSYTYAQKNDYSLRVNIPGTTRSSYNGTGVANGYVLNSSLDSMWNGVSQASANGETVEWRVSISEIGFGNCGALFGMAVYHHWFSGTGDDFGWPSNQWFDQPRTWQLVYLLNGPCTPPPGQSGKIAYVFRGNITDASSFYNLLVTNGYTVTMVPLTDILTTDFSTFDLIMVADDTGSLDQWGTAGLTANQVNKIKAGGKPIIGLGEGGYAFFGRFPLFIGWPNGWHGPDDNTTNAGTPAATTIFGALSSPLTVYTSEVNAVAIYLGGAGVPSDASPIGNEVPETDHSNIILQRCQLLWGFSGNPSSMTGDGTTLFLHTVAYMRSFQCPSEVPVQPGVCLQIVKDINIPAGTPVNPGDVIVYTISYTFSNDPACKLPREGRLTDYVPAGTMFVPGSASDGISPGPDGLLAWSITAASGTQTKTFKVQVGDNACNLGQVNNRATLEIPGIVPMTSAVVTRTVVCGPITLPNEGPMFAEGEVTIYPYPLLLGRASQIQVTLINNSTTAQNVTVEFQTSPDNFGIGLTFNTFYTSTLTVPAMGKAIALGWLLPTASGHFCIQIKITGPNLPTPINTQRNLDVTESLQGGVPNTLEFKVGNPTSSTADVMLVVDNTCPGWTAVVNPAILKGMAPGEVLTATLTVTPPNPVVLGSGCHIDVQGWIGDQLIGGFRKLDVPPVHLPAHVVPSWAENEITFQPDPPVVGQPGQICVQLENPLPVAVTVAVEFQVADFGAGIPFTPLTTQNFNLPPMSINNYCVPWTPAVSGTLHRCVLITLQQDGYQDMTSQRNVNLQRIPLSGLAGMDIPFVVGNPDLVPHNLMLVPTFFGLDSSWSVQFLTEAGGMPPAMLQPGQMVMLHMMINNMTLGNTTVAAPNTKYGAIVKIEVSEMLDGEQMGGFTIQLGNLLSFLPLIQK